VQGKDFLVWGGFVGWTSVERGQGGALGHRSGLSGCHVYGNGFQLIAGASTGVWLKFSFVATMVWWCSRAGAEHFGGGHGLGRDSTHKRMYMHSQSSLDIAIRFCRAWDCYLSTVRKLSDCFKILEKLVLVMQQVAL